MSENRIALKLDNVEIDNITQRKVSILGGTGSGKTTTLKMLAAVSPCPVFIFDPLNVIRIKGFEVFHINKKTINSGKAAADFLNKISMKSRKGFIFSFVNLLPNEISVFMNDLFSIWSPRDAIIMFDEAHEFIPESGMSIIQTAEVERAVRHWRNNNIGFVMDSQRPSFISKKVLALTDYLILYRLTWTHDVKAAHELLKNIVPNDSENIINSIQTKGFLEGYALDFNPS